MRMSWPPRLYGAFLKQSTQSQLRLQPLHHLYLYNRLRNLHLIFVQKTNCLNHTKRMSLFPVSSYRPLYSQILSPSKLVNELQDQPYLHSSAVKSSLSQESSVEPFGNVSPSVWKFDAQIGSPWQKWPRKGYFDKSLRTSCVDVGFFLYGLKWKKQTDVKGPVVGINLRNITYYIASVGKQSFILFYYSVQRLHSFFM